MTTPIQRQCISLALAFSIMMIGCSKKSTVQQSDSTGTQTTVQSSQPTTTTPTDSGSSVANNTQPSTQGATPAAGSAPFDSAKVSLKSLPPTVQPYVSSHFAGYKVVSAAYDPLCGGGPAMDVVIKNPGHPQYSLIFKPDGSFVQKEEDVSISVAPAIVSQTVKKQYADYKASNQIERLTLADGSLEYLVDLSKGKLHKEVIYSPAGAVVCETNE